MISPGTGLKLPMQAIKTSTIKKEMRMANKNLTIKLTNEQQKQIKDATGKKIAELNIDLAAKGHLTQEELDQVAGGPVKFTYD
jgi:hypothetical protein